MKAVFFDLDGTLVESLPGLTTTLNLTIGELGKEPYSEAKVRTFIGDGLWMLLRRALSEEEYSDQQITALQPVFQAYYKTEWEKGTIPFSGIRDLLNTLSEKEITLGVLSNKMHNYTVEITESLFSRDLIPLIYGQREGIPKKPDPSSLIEMCNEVNLSPKDVVYVGDSTVDLEVALNAKTAGIGVTWGYHDKRALQPYDLPLVDTVKELSQALTDRI